MKDDFIIYSDSWITKKSISIILNLRVLGWEKNKNKKVIK
jgi:hypothetical protein